MSNMSDNTIVLQGESSTATELLKIVEESEHFRQAEFRSPIIRNNTTGKDKFQLSASIYLKDKTHGSAE